MHCKPTHEYKTLSNETWWAYDYHDSGKPYGWSYSFNWVEEPKEKQNHDLGQALYEADQKSEKYSGRVFVLQEFLKRELRVYLLTLYPYKWLDENQFSEKLVKFTLQGDEYWYKIGHARKSGVPVWENFIWQSNKTEEINL
jgi:hypothetical protein